MLHNLIIGRYLCFHKHWHTDLNAYLNICSRERIFLLKGIQQSSLIIGTMIQRNLIKGVERMEVLITSYVKVFLGNEYSSYIHAARNAKVTSTGNIYEKTVVK